MTGTPIENNVWMAYLLTVFLVVTGFAVYDILYRRVPDRALVFFIPLAALAPLIQVYFILEYGRTPIFIWPVVAEALVGALLGFWSLRHGAGIPGGRRFCHAGGVAVPAALSGQTAHCTPVFTFSGLRLLCGDAG